MSYRRGVLVLWALIAALSCAAQQGGKLPDSVSTSDNASDGPSDSVMISTTSTDSAAGASSTDSARQDSAHVAADTASLRVVPDTTADRFKADADFAYANDPAYWKEVPEEPEHENQFLVFLGRLFGSQVFVVVFYLLLASVLAFVLYRIITDNNLHLFYKPSRMMIPATGEGEMNLLEGDLDQKIRDALQTGDHRLGARYLFLKALRLLDEKELIHYQAMATDQDYIAQMSPHPLGADFRFLARAYEYVWYGGFALSKEQFDRLSLYFQDFYKMIAGS